MAQDLQVTCRLYIGQLLTIGDQLKDPAVIARAYLSRAHNTHAAGKPELALNECMLGLAGPRRVALTDREVVLALRTMAIEEVRDDRARRRPGAIDTRETRERITRIVSLTREARQLIDDGRGGDTHNTMTSLEGMPIAHRAAHSTTA